MKQTLTLIAALLLAGNLMAQIAQGRIGGGNYIDYEGTSIPDAVGLDFNCDNQLEYSFSYGVGENGESIENGGIVFNWSEGGTNVATISQEEWDRIKNLTEGTQVGPSTGWYAAGDAYLNINNGAAQYVGFRFKLGNNLHFGWARVSVVANDDPETPYIATWHEIYYQSSPNTAIGVGDRTTAGIVRANNAPALKIGVTGLTIHINSTDMGGVQLFDMAGRCVASQSNCSDCSLIAPSHGVYIVKTSHMSRKVLVK